MTVYCLLFLTPLYDIPRYALRYLQSAEPITAQRAPAIGLVGEARDGIAAFLDKRPPGWL